MEPVATHPPDAADARVQLEVWIDVACPWCYVGRRNLAVAIADLDERDRPVVTWRAFQLDPTIPAEGIDADAYFAEKFGPDRSRFDEARERLTAMGEELGIAFRWDRQRVMPNTHLVQRALAAAGRSGEREALMDAAFAGGFELGVDLGDADVLRELFAEHVGADLADSIVTDALEDPTLTEKVDEEIAAARELGITGVPCFVADRAIAIPGAVPPPVLAQLLAEAAARREEANADA